MKKENSTESAPKPMDDASKRQFVSEFQTRMVAETLSFRRTLNEESDRGIALMAAAYLEDQLKALVEFVLVDDASVFKGMFETRGACSSFSAKSDIAYLMGLVSKETHRDLSLIRKIRNEFAHCAEPMTFSNPAVASRCKDLAWRGDEVEVDPKRKFIRSAVCQLAEIHSAFLVFSPLATRPVNTTQRSMEPVLISVREELKKRFERGEIDANDWKSMAKALMAMVDTSLDKSDFAPKD